MTVLLFLLFPSLGLPLLAAGRDPLPLLLALALYYLLPPLLYALGRLLPFSVPFLSPSLLVFLLPYLAYWPYAARQETPFASAYGVFLRGPGLALPLVAAVGYGLGLWLPFLPAAFLTFLLFLLAERALKRLGQGA